VEIREEDYLAHYGTPRHSGRYPWGSHNNVPGAEEDMPRNPDIIAYMDDMKKKGMTEKQIADGMGMTIKAMRGARTAAIHQKRAADVALVQRLKDQGYSPAAISQRTGIKDSTVRSYLKPGAADKADKVTTTANMLQKRVDDVKYLDVGKGVENIVGVSSTRLDSALEVLKAKGYHVHRVPQPQVGTSHDTKMKILVQPGVTQYDAFMNRDKIKQIVEFSDDYGKTFTGLHPPLQVNPKRVQVNWKEDGGAAADGVIYLRPGVPDLDLGGKNYGQVRIAIGSDHFMKGMAIYKDDLPKGVDIVFNSNKNRSPDKMDALKENKSEDNPFGSVVRQITTKDEHGKETVTSALNIVSGKKAGSLGNVEGNWDTWSKTLSSQFLSKQSPRLAREQLDMTYELRKDNFDSIKALTNPTVKKKLLEDFANSTDSSAVHLEAAAMPRQESKVLIPVPNMPSTQVYAPSFDNGERVILVRHPHGGTFEIPELTVNNRHRDAKKLLGDAQDAIGIGPATAHRLSGADFDGDTVLIIPNEHGRVLSTPALKELKTFDPTHEYPGYEGMHVMTADEKGTEMGKISNLITDMSLRNAPADEMARAVKHSMVVIDAEKKELNYKQSYIDNNIIALKRKYQEKGRGASTLISRARADKMVLDRKPRLQSLGGPIDPVTGEKRYQPTNRLDRNKQLLKITSTKLAETTDAMSLVSEHKLPMEVLYAKHSNKLKALANEARLEYLGTKSEKRSPSAAKAWEPQVKSLQAQLNLAQRNAPLERQAQVLASTQVRAAWHANPHMDDETRKKVEFQALTVARARTGADKHKIKITPDEWDAIQANAISAHKLSEILRHADMEIVRHYATPPTAYLMTPAKTARAKSMLELGFTRGEVAKALGVSKTTLDDATKGSD